MDLESPQISPQNLMKLRIKSKQHFLTCQSNLKVPPPPTSSTNSGNIVSGEIFAWDLKRLKWSVSQSRLSRPVSPQLTLNLQTRNKLGVPANQGRLVTSRLVLPFARMLPSTQKWKKKGLDFSTNYGKSYVKEEAGEKSKSGSESKENKFLLLLFFSFWVSEWVHGYFISCARDF